MPDIPLPVCSTNRHFKTEQQKALLKGKSRKNKRYFERTAKVERK